jgi:deoxyadenosine/deoxycytidine kinase
MEPTVKLNYHIVSIDGNIGSGKSTLLENIRNHYKSSANIIFLKEPVDDWEKIKDKNGCTMLQKFYENQEKYSFAFQMMAYISRLKILRDTVKEITKDPQTYYIIITERSLYTDKYVFAQMLYDQGNIEEVCYQIYLNWFEEFTKDFPISHIVYVKTEPTNCYNRIHKRSRVGEEVIPLEYLKDCHKYHESFLDINIMKISSRQIVLDGNIDIYENKEIMDKWLSQINLFITNV